MSVKRYSVWEDEMFEEKHAINSTNGMVRLMVKHEDYAALEQKLAESQREFRAADATIENLQMQVEKLAAENAEPVGYIDAEYAEFLRSGYIESCSVYAEAGEGCIALYAAAAGKGDAS